MTEYTLKDRTIYRDGEPIFSVAWAAGPDGTRGCGAWEVDAHARRIVQMLNAAELPKPPSAAWWTTYARRRDLQDKIVE